MCLLHNWCATVLHMVNHFLLSYIVVSWGKLLVLAALVLCTSPVSGRLTGIQRINYGVVFEPQGHIQLSAETWMHTFEIHLPDEMNFKSIQQNKCNKTADICEVVSTSYKQGSIKYLIQY